MLSIVVKLHIIPVAFWKAKLVALQSSLFLKMLLGLSIHYLDICLYAKGGKGHAGLVGRKQPMWD